jgi:ribosome-associated toxin RatA of RatAB toxin-antitoxin module
MSQVTRTATIAATPEVIRTIMLDVENHPSWQKEVQKIEVLETDGSSRPVRTRVTISAMGQSADYELLYTYDEADNFEYHLTVGEMMTKNDFTFAVSQSDADPATSSVAVVQELDLKWPLPGFMIDQLTLKGVKDMLKALTEKAEQA